MKKLLKISFIIFLFFTIILFCFFVYYFGVYLINVKNLVLNDDLLKYSINNCIIFDDNNNLLTKKEDKNYITINEIPKNVINAFISIEDKEFYNHNGINLKRIISASINNILSGKITQGASTISQQLIKNTHLSNEKTIERKLKEIAYSVKLENNYNKDEIIEMYLNAIYFGCGNYGIKDAVKYYFNKDVNELSINESAMLAGLIKAPSKFNPINNYEKCIARKNIVLKEMLEDGYINENTYNNCISDNIIISNDYNDTNIKKNITLINSIINEASEILNLTSDEIINNKYKIYTYIDNDYQNILDLQINNSNNYIQNEYGNTADGLGVIIDNTNNSIVAISAKSEYDLSNLNRQPGSAIKPALVYALALENNQIYPCSKILDEEINYNGYSPKNVGGKYSGYVSVRKALSDSLNIPAVKLLNDIGINNAKDFATKNGIKFDKADNGLAIALGGFTKGINLTDLTNSFTTFANLGKYCKASLIKEIKNTEGITIYKRNINYNNVMRPDTAYLITNMLIDGVKNGTSKKLTSLPYEIAGKTGTVAVKNSNNNTDAISIAYTSNLTMGVWLGNYSYENEYNLTSKNNGGTYATQIIKDTFLKIYKDQYPNNFDVPDNIIYSEIDKLSYDNNEVKLANKNNPERYSITEIFNKNNLPLEVANSVNDYEITNFNVINNNDVNIVSFNCEKFVDYEIYCSYENITNKLATVSNSIEKPYSFSHENLNEFSKYIYYVKYKPINSNTYKNSNKIIIYTNQNFNDKILNKYLNNNINQINEDNWLFY